MNTSSSRRQFLRDTGRLVVLGGLVAGGIRLVMPRGGPACTRQFVCSACNKLEQCPLSPAASYRQAVATERDSHAS